MLLPLACLKRYFTKIEWVCVALLGLKSRPKFDEGIFDSYVHLNLVVLGLHIYVVLTCLSGSGAFPLLRAVGTRWGAGGRSLPPSHNGRLVKPVLISGRGTDYANHSTTRPSGFSNLPTALLLDMWYHLYFRPWPYRCILCSAIEYSIVCTLHKMRTIQFHNHGPLSRL